jgi:hypothetical protein
MVGKAESGRQKQAYSFDSLFDKALDSVKDQATLKSILEHKHGSACHRLLKHRLLEGEEIVLEAKQSYLNGFAPARLIATNKRIIIIKPSFWNLYAGHNIVRSTKYNMIPYDRIVNVINEEGLLLSMIKLRLQGAMESEGSIEQVQGVRTRVARVMTAFLEKVIEDYGKETRNPKEPARPSPASKEGLNYVGMEKARRLVGEKGSRFIWLGIEDLSYPIKGLYVDRALIEKIDIRGILERNDREEMKKLENCVIVGYTGEGIESHLARRLKQYGIESYILEGGVEAQIRENES